MRKMFAGNRRRLVLPAAFLIVAAVLVGSAAAATLQNAGFETGDTSGWSTSGFVGVNSGSAKVGTYAASVATGDSAPGTGSTLSQSVHLNAGQTITGWARWEGGDWCGFDSGTVSVGGTTVWSATNCSGADAWAQWSYTASATGDYTVSAHIENTADAQYSSSMGLDAGEPSTTATPGRCWNPLGTDGCFQSGRAAVCTKDGFQDILVSQVNDPSSPYYGAAPAAYVEGYGLVCTLSNIASYGGDPSAYHDAGYKVDQVGGRTPDGYTDADFGAWYEYFAKS
ncbi:MAG: hypothetical protein QOH73_1393 [Gaiellaceae bacterium]|jgi:hypothetical protein|nr:hypothetical protein [Gaiellaceae bacterium]